jgi:hypothetical protein
MHADGEMTPSVAACIDAAARFLAAHVPCH